MMINPDDEVSKMRLRGPNGVLHGTPPAAIPMTGSVSARETENEIASANGAKTMDPVAVGGRNIETVIGTMSVSVAAGVMQAVLLEKSGSSRVKRRAGDLVPARTTVVGVTAKMHRRRRKATTRVVYVLHRHLVDNLRRLLRHLHPQPPGKESVAGLAGAIGTATVTETANGIGNISAKVVVAQEAYLTSVGEAMMVDVGRAAVVAA